VATSCDAVTGIEYRPACNAVIDGAESLDECADTFPDELPRGIAATGQRRQREAG